MNNGNSTSRRREDHLFGNGRLTVAARLASVAAAVCLPIFAGAMSWAWIELWSAFKETRNDIKRIEIAVAGGVERGNSIRAELSRLGFRVERLEARVESIGDRR